MNEDLTNKVNENTQYNNKPSNDESSAFTFGVYIGKTIGKILDKFDRKDKKDNNQDLNLALNNAVNTTVEEILGYSRHPLSPEEKRVLGVIDEILKDIPKYKGPIVTFTTNNPESLDESMKERFQSRIYLDAPAGTGKTKNPVEEIYRKSQEILIQNARDVKNITYIEMNQPLPSAEEWKKFQAFMDEHSKTEITPDDAYKPKDNN